MSAIVGVCDRQKAHILTDAASTHAADGIVLDIARKHVITRKGVAIASAGVVDPCRTFGRLADRRTPSLDELVDAAPGLWAEAAATLPVGANDSVSCLLFAGWSDKRARVEMWVMETSDDGSAVKLGKEDSAIYVAGPSESSREASDPWIECIAKNLGAFDPDRDGVELMEALRRHPRALQQGSRPVVGGFIQHTQVAPTETISAIVHHWPGDRVGQVIDIDAGVGRSVRWPVRQWSRAWRRPGSAQEEAVGAA